MIKIEVNQNDLEKFINSIENDYKRLSFKHKLDFNEFKKYFCDNKIFITKTKKESYINGKLKNKKVSQLKENYEQISSSNSIFFLKIRKFIIETFTKNSKFCPYCGKTPIIFYERGKDKENSYSRLFQFDHFFPKNSHNKGIINFYNLIPSCNSCNHLKLENNPLTIIQNGGIIFHPYFGNLYLDEKEELKMDFGENCDIRLNYLSENSKFFKLGQKYLNSQDTFNIFNFIQDKRTKMKDEQMRFKKNTKSLEQLKDYFFKNYYPTKEEDILKYSNGKLKKDLIENLNI